MKKHWKKLTAVAVAVAVVGCLGVFSSDRQLKATDDDGNASTEVVSGEIAVEVPDAPEVLEETAPVEDVAVETPAEEATEIQKADEEAIEDSEVVEETTEDSEVVEETTEDSGVVEETTEDSEDNLDLTVTVKSSLEGVEEVESGTQITLIAELSQDYNKLSGYTIQWQKSLDGVTWEDEQGATGLTYTFALTEDNDEYSWRVVVSVPE